MFHVVKLKLNEVKRLVPGHPSRWQNSGHLTPGAQAVSSSFATNNLYELGQVMPTPLGLSFSL